MIRRTHAFFLLFLPLGDVTHAETVANVYSQSYKEIVVRDAWDFKEVEFTSNYEPWKLIVSVRNREKLRWAGVKVKFIFPSGNEFLATGATSIDPGRQSTYEIDRNDLPRVKREWIANEKKIDRPQVIVSHLVRDVP